MKVGAQGMHRRCCSLLMSVSTPAVALCVMCSTCVRALLCAASAGVKALQDAGLLSDVADACVLLCCRLPGQSRMSG